MSAPAGTDDQVRRSAISFRQQKGANYTLAVSDVQEKLIEIIPNLNTLSDQEFNRLSRLFEETYANPPPAGSGGRKMKGGEDMPLYSAINKISAADEKRYKKGAATVYDDEVIEMASALAMKSGISFERMQRIKSLLDDAKNKDIDESLYNAALADLRKRSVLPTGAGGFKRKSQTERFSRCVKMVRKTVTPRSGSNKESAAIAICTKTILHKRGRTIKRYSKKRLVTQRRK